VLRIPVGGAPIMPNQLRFMEWGLRALGETRLEEQEKLSAILLLTSYTRSFALLRGDLAAAYEAGDPIARSAAGYGALITRLTSAEEFPALHAVVASGAFEDGAEGIDGLDDDFQFGLDRILDGVAVLIQLRE
jgi:hypothetical protein